MIDLSRTALIELTEAAWVFLGSSHPVDPSDKDLIEEISHNGLAVIRGFYDRVKVEALKKEIDRIFHEHSETVWSDPQGSDHRMFQAEIFSEALKSTCMNLV
jgi:hypothetical protein